MRAIAMAGSVVGLFLTIAPAVLVFVGCLTWQAHANLMAAGMALWFTTAPFWFKE